MKVDFRLAQLHNALNTLRLLGCTYDVKDWSGAAHAHGMKPKRNTKLSVPKGTYSTHFKPYLADLAAVGVAEVPYGDFKVDSFQASLGSYLTDLFGVGSFQTTRDTERKTICIFLSPDVMKSAGGGASG